MQGSRLFQIMYYLLDRGEATAPELAEKFEVSVRTIYRDIDALSGAGIPVYAEAGRNGGIRLMHDFTLDKVVLSKEEKQEILAALQSLNTARSAENSQTLQKLSALFQMGAQHWLEVDFSGWGNPGFDNEKFSQLKSAVIHCRSVKICYADAYGETGERVVQPHKLVYRAKAWYLQAFCTKKQDWRLFKLNRILAWEVLQEGFVRRMPPKMSEGAGETYPEIRLRFAKEMAYRVYDEFAPSQVERQENGDLIAAARMPVDGWLTGFLLSFGTQVEILAPEELRKAVAEQVKLLYERHTGYE